MLYSGIPSVASNRPVSLPGSVPDGSTSQRHCRGLPRSGADWPAVTTTIRYRNIGSVTTASAGSLPGLEPIATSASRLATSTLISAVTATPDDTSTEPA